MSESSGDSMGLVGSNSFEARFPEYMSPSLRRVMIIGSSSRAAVYLQSLRKRQYLPVYLQFSSSDDGNSDEAIVVADNQLSTLVKAIQEAKIDEVVVPFPYQGPNLEELARFCAEMGVTFRALVSLPVGNIGESRASVLARGTYLLSLETVPYPRWALAIKRCIDIGGSLIGLICCAALYIWYGPSIRRQSGASVLYRQTRIGQNGRHFMLYKFRTMYADAEARLADLLAQNEMQGHMFKLRNDPRITPVGRKLRRTHWDEAPQFWNVLKGEMSLVGTRPPTPSEVAGYEPRHRRRLSMKPGITGLWQVQGNGAVDDFEQVVRLDCQYIDQWSLSLDLKLIAKTMVKMVSGSGW